LSAAAEAADVRHHTRKLRSSGSGIGVTAPKAERHPESETPMAQKKVVSDRKTNVQTASVKAHAKRASTTTKGAQKLAKDAHAEPQKRVATLAKAQMKSTKSNTSKKFVNTAASSVKPASEAVSTSTAAEKASVAHKHHSVASARPAAPAAAARAVEAKVAAKTSAPARSVAAAKPLGQKVSATPMTPKQVAERVAAAQQQQAVSAQKKPINQRHGFKKDEFIVYPAHGVGQIVGIEEQEIAGISLELFVISFEKDKMTLRVPTGKLVSVGMRKLADEDVVRKAMETLKGRARVKRTMWSRRAQEYEAKINSGDLVSIAEVVRDLYRSEQQPEQSYSERQLYEAALDRMAREIAAVDRLDERGAVQRITEVLSKSAKGRRLAAEGAEAADSEEVKAA